MKHLLRKMASIANELDLHGLEKEANVITQAMLKVAQLGSGIQPVQPSPNPRSQFNQENQPYPVKGVDTIADNTGTNLLRAGTGTFFNGGKQLLMAIGQAGEGIFTMTVGNLQNLLGLATLPTEAIAEVTSLGMHSLTDPLLTQIEQQNATIKMLLDALKRLKSQPSTPENNQKIKETAQKLAEAAASKSKIEEQVMSLINQRKTTGQYTLNEEEFAKTVDYAVKNRLTVRQMYDQAVRNRGGDEKAQNYANNIIAKYRTIHPDPDSALVKPTKLT